jgi:hypothetical protein
LKRALKPLWYQLFLASVKLPDIENVTSRYT